MKKLMVFALGIMMTVAFSATPVMASSLSTKAPMEMVKKVDKKHKKKDCCKKESKCKHSKKCKNGKGDCCSGHNK